MRRRGLAPSVALVCALAMAGCSGSDAGSPASSTAPAAPGTAASSTVAARPSAVGSPAGATSTARVSRPPTPVASSRATGRAHATAQQLPLHDDAGDSRQVITVVAPSGSSTTGTLQAWRRIGHGWARVGPSVHAYLGDQGIGQASESSDTTPTGSYTLTKAFGRNVDPGTALPYTRTTPQDWWISQPGPLYNTRQRCASDCGFTQGDPNEHLYYETPFYEYAVVIDYNTGNAPGGVRPGAGSAFFLHVTVHEPTQGCVSIDEDQLVRILRWVDPAKHPRIMLGIR